MTTFGTPWGRYRWLKMPFGISPAPEEFQRRLDEALAGLEGCKAIADDILVFGCGESDKQAIADHDRKLRSLLVRCREKNIKLNSGKLQLRLKEVSYMGHVLSCRRTQARSWQSKTCNRYAHALRQAVRFVPSGNDQLPSEVCA